MFSSFSPAFLFDVSGRLEQPHPLRDGQGAGIIKPKGHKESRLVANLNLALSGLNPSHTARITTIVDSPLPSPYSFLSATTPSPSRKTHHLHSPSSASMSATHSSRSSGSDLQKAHHQHHTQEPRSRHSSLREPTRSRPGSSRESLPSHPAVHLFHSGIALAPTSAPYTPRPSLDSIASSSSGSSYSYKGKDKDTHAPPRKVPPPLHLGHSNHHDHTASPSTGSPIIEITTPPPRVDSKRALGSLSATSASLSAPASLTPSASQPHPHPHRQTPFTPPSPDFQPPSVEEQRRRRLEKVMRTLGEDVPAELVYRGGTRRIINVNVFPDPPSPAPAHSYAPTDTHAVIPGGGGGGSLTRKEQKALGAGEGLRRRGSFTLAAFPHLSAVKAGLLPTAHARAKSRELVEGPATPTPARSGGTGTNMNAGTIYVDRQPRARPESVLLSPMVFRRPVSQLVLLDDDSDDDDDYDDGNSNDHDHDHDHRAGSRGGGGRRRKGEEGRERARAEKLARRSSLHTTTVLPASPVREAYGHHQSHQHRARVPSPDPLATPRASPRRISRLDATSTPPAFRLVVDDAPLTPGSAPSHTPSPSHSPSQPGSRPPSRSRSGDSHGTGTTSSSSNNSSANTSRSNSSIHLPLAEYDRPDTPFASAAVPLLVPPGVGMGVGVGVGRGGGARGGRSKGGERRGERRGGEKRERDAVARREKRQGWSGEWNRGDMQDVIQKLRTLR